MHLDDRNQSVRNQSVVFQKLLLFYFHEKYFKSIPLSTNTLNFCHDQNFGWLVSYYFKVFKIFKGACVYTEVDESL